MNLKNLLLIFLTFSASIVFAQTTVVIADWETESTSYNCPSWGNGHFGGDAFDPVTNPSATGINTSSTVATWWKANDAQTWAGCGFTPTEPFDFTLGAVAQVCMKVYADHECDVLFKLENAGDPDHAASIKVHYSTPNEWQELCADFTQADNEGDIGLGHSYEKIALFMDFGVVPGADAQYYFDDLSKTYDQGQIMISSNESDDTSHVFAFGNGHFEDSTFVRVNNPTPNAINNSATVQSWCEANDAQNWGGFRYVVDTIDLTGSKAQVCISLLATHTATMRVKLFESETGPTVRQEVDYTTPNEWQQLCFDFTQPGINGNIGQGAIYKKLDFYLDYGPAPAADDCYFFDNVMMITNGNGVLPTFIQNLVSNNSDLSTFKGYVDAIDLWDQLNQNGVTAFVPTNAAFDAMDATAKAALDNNTDNAVFNMVMHHFLTDSLPASLLTDGSSFITNNGQEMTVSGNTVNGANIASSSTAFNGFLHTLDAVMTYPEWPEEFLYSDFEGNGVASDNDGWWSWGTAGLSSYQVIDNPHSDSDNSSAKVLEYRKFPKDVTKPDGTAGTTLWYQGIAHHNIRPYNFFGPMQEVCFDIWAPEGDHMIFLKMAGAMTPNGKTGWFQSYTGGSWQKVCFDATDMDYYDDTRNGLNNIFPGSALFFDTENKEFPVDTAVFYLDNWRTRNILVGTNNISVLKNFEIYPNPTSDFLNIMSDTPIKTATVLDITGRTVLVATDPVHNGLEVSALKAGMYFIRFTGLNGEDQGVIRFVKQ